MENKLIMGIDTSAYTTSISLINALNEVILDERIVLDVKKGNLGLRQQEALFQHMNNLPKLIDKIEKDKLGLIEEISVSGMPRNIEGSYMPVFLAGLNTGKIISNMLDVSLNIYSHQQGHIASGILDNNVLKNKKIIALHISGGTTEALLVNKITDIKLIATTLDISFGKLIDRIGVLLDQDFPAGKHVDKLSENGKVIDKNVPIHINKDLNLNISGMENYYSNMYKKSHNANDVSKTLLYGILKSLEKWISLLSKKYETYNVLITGGVGSNTYIRENLSIDNINIYFAQKKYCTDNAVGTAYIKYLMR